STRGGSWTKRGSFFPRGQTASPRCPLRRNASPTSTRSSSRKSFSRLRTCVPQIRLLLSSVWSLIETGVERANHTLLYGLPACAKTRILLALGDIFGEGPIMRLDATRTTRAGLEQLVLRKMKRLPPIWVAEEIEKVSEDILTMWLGAMDDQKRKIL